MENKLDLKNKFTLVGIIILGVIVFFNYIFPVVLPFLIGLLLSYVFRPIVNYLEKYNVPRETSTFLSMILILGTFGWAVYYILKQLFEQIVMLIDKTPEYMGIISIFIENVVTKIDELLVAFPPILSEVIINFQSNFTEIIVSALSSFDYTSIVYSVPKIFIDIIIALFTSYFFTADKHLYKKLRDKYIVPLFKNVEDVEGNGNVFDATKTQLVKSLWGYFKTQLILMVYVGVICMVALFFMGSKYSVALGVAIAVVDALPIFGSGFFLWPMSVYYLLTGRLAIAIGHITLYVFLQVLRQILQPKILGEQINLHPLLALFSMYVGYEFIGVFGFVIAPLLVIFFTNVLFCDYDSKSV